MTRNEIINRIGSEFHTSNIEGGEYSYVKEAHGRRRLEELLGHSFEHYKLDIRFESGNTVVLVETKQVYVESDKAQLIEYVNEEKALHPSKKIIAILANTNNDDFLAYKTSVDDEHFLSDETVIESMEHYVSLFELRLQNNRETVLRNTFDLNVLLHKNDIDESLRSQFVGTALLYIKSKVRETGLTQIDDEMKNRLNGIWENMSEAAIRAEIGSTLVALLDGSVNKQKKIELLQKNVLDNQKVRNLSKKSWKEILDTILLDIYKYINADSSEGQDILNMFFVAFNKYTGKSDKNQAFTPDHITEFMCRVTEVDHTKTILDGTCGSASFLVQAMVKELADCRRNHTEQEALALMDEVKRNHIYGIEVEEKAFGLSTTNMLIHGDGNSNIILGSIFDNERFIRDANPDIILMNPPYNAKPKSIPDYFKTNWGNAKDGKEDPTKGFVFVQFISNVIKKINIERERDHRPRKEVKMAVLLPVSAAIGTSSIVAECKKNMLKDNTLEAVFTLPNEIFYPGASVCVCCMVFTLGKPHVNADGTVNKTFFGYYKEDGFKKKKNLGRVEQYNSENASLWKEIEERWLSMYRNKEIVDGLSATAIVDGDSEWLCEAYMKTDYSRLCEADFQQTLNNYLAYLVKEEKLHES